MTGKFVASIIALEIVVAAAGAGAIIRHNHRQSVSAAHDSVAVALAGQVRAVAEAHAAEARADSAHAAAARAERAADALARREAQIVARYRQREGVAPDTCRPVLVLADSALAVADEKADSLQNALRTEKGVSAGLRASLDSVIVAAGRTEAAATLLDHASRPSWRERLTPRLGLGATVGVNPVTGRPAVAAGLTLGWSF